MKPVALPKTLAVTEGVASNPWAARYRVSVLPDLIGSRLVIQQPARPANVRIVLKQRIDLGTDAPRGIPVIIIPVDDDLAAGEFAGQISLCSDGKLRVERDITDSIVHGHQVSHRI